MTFINPYGGEMNEVSESSIQFPHRAGDLYKIIHLVTGVKKPRRKDI